MRVTTKDSQKKIINNDITKRGNRHLAVYWGGDDYIGVIGDARGFGDVYDPTVNRWTWDKAFAWYKIT